jgi:signal peptidase I
MNIIRKVYFFLIDTIQSILIAASIFLVIYIFFFRPFEVTGDSMFPNFKDKEYVLTNLIVLRFLEPKKGDVIVFKAPPAPDKDFIKRVIGVPGDTIMLKNGHVFLNREQLNEEKYLNPDIKTYGGSFLQEGQSVTVPEGNFFVLGDNRPYSSDSREWGFVPRGNVIGESFFSYWPISEMGIIRNPYK